MPKVFSSCYAPCRLRLRIHELTINATIIDNTSPTISKYHVGEMKTSPTNKETNIVAIRELNTMQSVKCKRALDVCFIAIAINTKVPTTQLGIK